MLLKQKMLILIVSGTSCFQQAYRLSENICW